MDDAELATAAGICFRYIHARAARYHVSGPLEPSEHDIYPRLKRGLTVHRGGVLISAELVAAADQSPPITVDGRYGDFHAAVFKSDDALPGARADTLAALRAYVLRGEGLPPSGPEHG